MSSKCHCLWKDSGWIRIFHPNLKLINIYLALCWNWVVIHFPVWEVEADGQLAVGFAGRVHNPTYITWHVCRIGTAVLGRKMRCLEIKSAVQEWKIYPLSTRFLSTSFICIPGSHVSSLEHSAFAAHVRPAGRVSPVVCAHPWARSQPQRCLTPLSLGFLTAAGALLRRWGKKAEPCSPQKSECCSNYGSADKVTYNICVIGRAFFF